jgi:hypothetical protein
MADPFAQRVQEERAMYPNPHPDMCPWHEAAVAFGAPNIKWCETTLCGWISEPANTWSNLPYLVLGILVMLGPRASACELRWMGPAMLLMGVFSFVYHASNNYLSQVFDFIGMYLLVFWMLVINLRRLGLVARASQRRVFAALCAGGTVLVHVMYVAELKFQLVIALATLAIVLSEWMARRVRRVPLRNFGMGLVLLFVAQAASLADLSRVYCEPDSWLQGHAVWHVLSAIGLYFAYRHYRDLLQGEFPDRAMVQTGP